MIHIFWSELICASPVCTSWPHTASMDQAACGCPCSNSALERCSVYQSPQSQFSSSYRNISKFTHVLTQLYNYVDSCSLPVCSLTPPQEWTFSFTFLSLLGPFSSLISSLFPFLCALPCYPIVPYYCDGVLHSQFWLLVLTMRNI